jgi:hypothetical protein
MLENINEQSTSHAEDVVPQASVKLPRPFSIDEAKSLFEFRENLFNDVKDEATRRIVSNCYIEYLRNRVEQSRER